MSNRNTEESSGVDAKDDFFSRPYLIKLFRTASPLDNGVVTTLRPTLAWEKGPPEAARYSVLILGMYRSLVEEAKDIPNPQYTVSKDLNNGEFYYWKVNAYDGQGKPIGVTEQSVFSVHLSSK